MSEWSNDGAGSSRDRDRNRHKKVDEYRSRGSDVIDVSEYSKRTGNGSSSRQHNNSNSRNKDRWTSGGRSGDSGGSRGNNSGSNGRQHYISPKGSYGAFSGNGNGMMMTMNEGYAGQYMGNPVWNAYPSDGSIPAFAPSGTFAQPGGFGMGMQGQYQGGPVWWGDDGSQFQAVDNGWGKRARNGKSRDWAAQRVRDQSDDEDFDARERRRERLKRRRRSAGIESDSDKSADDDGRGKDTDALKTSRHDAEHRSDRSRDSIRHANSPRDRTESEGDRHRRTASMERERSKRQRSPSRDAHLRLTASTMDGRSAPQMHTNKNDRARNEKTERQSNRYSDRSSYAGRSHRGRDRESDSLEGPKKRDRKREVHRDLDERDARPKDSRQSSRSTASPSRSSNRSHRPDNGDIRPKNNVREQKRAIDGNVRHRSYSQTYRPHSRDDSERCRSPLTVEEIKSTQRSSNRVETEIEEAKCERRESKPSDAMQAAIEASLGDVASAIDVTHKVAEINDEAESDEEQHPPPITRARPDEVYEQISQVGEGTYGQVYKAKGDRTGVIVALKKIRMESEKDGFPITAMREIKLLQGLRHENVVRLHEMLLSKNSVYMVFEYLQHDLNGILAQPSIVFDKSHLKSLAQQLLQGLAYLHRHSILHRDLKCSNLLLSSEGTLKLADFGLARRYQKRSKGNLDYTNRVVTLWYRPPELLFGETCYDDAIDVWGAGCIFLELFTRKPVFQGNDEIHQVQVLLDMLGPIETKDWPEVETLPWYDLVRPRTDESEQKRSNDGVSKGLRGLFAQKIPADALDVAEALLCYDPGKRISASQALKMAYFARNLPRPEKPGALLSRVIGEWHELESRNTKRMQPPTLNFASTSATQQARTDSPHLLPAQKMEMGPPQSHPSPNINRAAPEKRSSIPA